MRIAALGDIHSNHFALEACLEKIEKLKADGIAFLGDYVSDCSCPQKTLTLLREAKNRFQTWFVRGNREEYLLEHRDSPDDGWRYGSAKGSLLYTYDCLTAEDLKAFENMPQSMRISPEDAPPFEICHGSLTQSRCELFPDTPQAQEVLTQMTTNLLICAHTHTAFILERDGKAIVNGGAVGMPTKGDCAARFSILDSDNKGWKPQLVRAEYDVENVIREFRESGFSEKSKVWARAVAAALRTGRDCHTACVAMAVRISMASGISTEEESVWELAAAELGIDELEKVFQKSEKRY